MKILALLLFVLTTQTPEKGISSCDVNVSKVIAEQTNWESTIIQASITGSPCYDAILKLEVFISDDLVYSYAEKFKTHVAIHWEDVLKKDATQYLANLIEDYNFINCSDLPEIEQSGDLPYYEKLLISDQQYNEYKNSGCRAYIHTYKRYESNRIIVFPANEQEVVIVR